MGEVKKILAEGKLQERDIHNGRVFVDLSENIHFHYREHRICFSVEEYRLFAEAIGKGLEVLNEAVEKGYKENPEEKKARIIGGRQYVNLKMKKPLKSAYFNNRFVIEEQAEGYTDKFHIHFRDYRLVMNNERTLLQFFDTVAEAKKSWFGDVRKLKIASLKYRWGDEKDHLSRIRKKHPGDKEPILVSCDHYIVDGHARVTKAIRIGKTKIEGIVLDCLFIDTHFIRLMDKKLKIYARHTNDWKILDHYKQVLAKIWGRYNFKKEKGVTHY